MIELLWVAGVYALVIYPVIKILQGVRQDVRDGRTDYPTRGWRLVD